MRALCVVVPPPLLDDDLCFSQRIEDFPVEKFVPEACVEALDVAVLPGASRLNVGGLCSNHADPVAYGFSNKLRPIIGTNVGWYAMQNEEIGEDIDHIGRIEFPLHPNGQTFPTKLIQDVEGSEHAPIVGSMMNKIIGPDVVHIACPQADTRAIIEPQAAFLRLFLWDLKPLPSP